MQQQKDYEYISIDPRLITCMRMSRLRHFSIMKSGSRWSVTAAYTILTVDGKEIMVRQSMGLIYFLIAEACQLNITDSLGIELDEDLRYLDMHIVDPNILDASIADGVRSRGMYCSKNHKGVDASAFNF
jgi:hypothetical protein